MSLIGNVVLHSVPRNATRHEDVTGVRLIRADQVVYVSKNVLEAAADGTGPWGRWATFDGDLLVVTLVCGWRIRYLRRGSWFNPLPSVLFQRTHGLPPA